MMSPDPVAQLADRKGGGEGGMCDCSQAPTGSLQKLDTTARCDITAEGWMQQLIVDIISYSTVQFSVHFLQVE